MEEAKNEDYKEYGSWVHEREEEIPSEFLTRNSSCSWTFSPGLLAPK